jgi:hypothetical protein
MNAAHTPGPFGVFFQVGHWEKSLAFRVDDRNRPGCKRLICGACVDPAEAVGNAIKAEGQHKCEACGRRYGDPDCHDMAISLAKAQGAQP